MNEYVPYSLYFLIWNVNPQFSVLEMWWKSQSASAEVEVGGCQNISLFTLYVWLYVVFKYSHNNELRHKQHVGFLCHCYGNLRQNLLFCILVSLGYHSIGCWLGSVCMKTLYWWMLILLAGRNQIIPLFRPIPSYQLDSIQTGQKLWPIFVVPEVFCHVVIERSKFQDDKTTLQPCSSAYCQNGNYFVQKVCKNQWTW